MPYVGVIVERRKRSPLVFKETDVKRAIRACRKGGVDVGGVEVDPKTGVIRILDKTGQSVTTNPLDDWIAKKVKDARQA